MVVRLSKILDLDMPEHRVETMVAVAVVVTIYVDVGHLRIAEGAGGAQDGP